MKICIASRLVTSTLLVVALHATPAIAQQSIAAEPPATASGLVAPAESSSVPFAPATLRADQPAAQPPSASLPDASPARPMLVDASAISAGDTAWMLTSTALVLLMTIPGVALFYGGMVRKKNVLTTMLHSFVAVCIVSVLWAVVGYSIAFSPGNAFIGGLDRFMLHGLAFVKEAGKLTVHPILPAIPESVFMMFQMTFAIITPALITGAFAERMKFSAMIAFIALWSVLVYAPVAHWVWDPQGWLAAAGVLDFAGGTVVHINAGISGLVAAIIIGPRTGFGKEPMPPHNLTLTVIGASLLWIGWFGFNAGSAGAADGRAGMAMLVTQLAAATGALAWMSVEWARRGKPSVLGLASGAVAGLVGITPASGFVGIGGALVIGAVAGVAAYWASTSLKAMLGYDDSLDVFGVHAVAGIVGALLTGVFAVKAIGGVDGNIALQAIGVVATAGYAAVATMLILAIVDFTIGVRVAPEHEQNGLDIQEHGEHVL